MRHTKDLQMAVFRLRAAQQHLMCTNRHNYGGSIARDLEAVLRVIESTFTVVPDSDLRRVSSDANGR